MRFGNVEEMTLDYKFKRCMVFAGGGFRFGAYLGMFAAASELNQAPDIVLASCGGAIAAAIIQALPDNAARLAWLCGAPMYRYCSQLQPNPDASLQRVLWRALQRRCSQSLAQRIPDLFI
jgi:sugar (pentulose or hexulose) kinase